MAKPYLNKKKDKKASKVKRTFGTFGSSKVRHKSKGESYLFQRAKQGKKTALKMGGLPTIQMLEADRRREENISAALHDARDLVDSGMANVAGACSIYPDIQDALEVHGDLDKALEAHKKALAKLNKAISSYNFHDAQMKKHDDDTNEGSDGPSGGGGVGSGHGPAGDHGTGIVCI
jgi:hypothetical protein